MNTFSWVSAIGGDWASASLWDTGQVPNDSQAAVSIAQSGSYTVTIAAGMTDTVNQITVATATATLAVDGMLHLAGAVPATFFQGNGTVAVGTGGVIDGTGLLTAGFLANAGTLVANGGSNAELFIDAQVRNTGTVLANNGVLAIGGFTNLSGSILTGGTYIAVGSIAAGATFAVDNILAFGLNGGPGLLVDAADIVLDGVASLIETFGSGGNLTLEQQLQTIAATGTLALLHKRGFATTNSLVDNGLLLLDGGTLATTGLTVGGTIAGYGSITGPISNAGTIIATGGTLGTLNLAAAINGTGALAVAADSTLLLHGGTTGSLDAAGKVVETGTLAVTGAITGAGTIIVEHGGALEIGGAASAAVSFGGSAVSLTLDAPLTYHGTLAGFGLGDTLVLKGLQATSATVTNGNTLLVKAGGTTLDSVTLSGNYSSAVFTATTLGNDTVVTNLSGAPARNDMPITLVSVTDSVGLAGTLLASIENEITFAAAQWGQYITGATPLRVSLSVVASADFGSEVALGSPGGYIADGTTLNGHAVYVPNSIYALNTGNYASGTSVDVAITLVASASNLANLYINADPAAGTAVPAGKIDLLTVLTHEFGHGLGFLGLANRFSPATGTSPVIAGAPETLFDSFIADTTINGTVTATFTGPNAEAAYAAAINAATPTPVPLFFSGGSLAIENFYHLDEYGVPAAADDLMSPILASGTYTAISAIDLGILADIGVPVTAGVACYGKGTRIATPRGEVPVEALREGDWMTTARGVPMPVVWAGHRAVDCRRHPNPARVQPVLIRAHAFGPGQPNRDLVLSPDHAIYARNVLIPVHRLINGQSVVQMDYATIDYYHIELPIHDILLANGLPAESYLATDRNRDLGGSSNVIALHPEFVGDTWERAGFARLVLLGPELDAVRADLATRAHAAGPARTHTAA